MVIIRNNNKCNFSGVTQKRVHQKQRPGYGTVSKEEVWTKAFDFE